MITTLNVLGTIVTIVANVAIVVGFPIYVVSARRDAYPARHRAPDLGSTSERIRVIDSPELQAARELTERLAQGIEERARLWDFAPELVGTRDALNRYDQSAGSPAYLDLTPGALNRAERSAALDPDRVFTTGEMFALFGVPLGLAAPGWVDEWGCEPEPVPVGA